MKGQNPWMDFMELASTPISIIFDVGANEGQTALELCQVFPAATIYSFEPVRSTFDELVRNTSALEHVHCLPVGLSSAPGSIEIFRQVASGWNSIPKQIDRGLGKCTVQLETIDRFCSDQGITRVNIVKTDTEGHDLEVLKGASNLITAGAIDAIYSEVGFRREDSGHTFFPDLLEYLQPRGYQFYGLFGSEGIWFVDHPEGPAYAWSNALFVRDGLVRNRYGEQYENWLTSIQPQE